MPDPGRRLILGAVLLAALPGAARAAPAPLRPDWPADATPADVEAAHAALQAWIAAFRAGDYAAQWRLTDPRLRRWTNLPRWRKAMGRAAHRNGGLLDYEVSGRAAVEARQLPCTEQGHCYRRDVPYVVFILRTRYAKAAPAQPEYAAMALSDEGWRFGGGTLLNRPLGETAVMLSETDEQRYSPGARRLERNAPGP